MPFVSLDVACSSDICSSLSPILLLLICVFLHLGNTKRPAAPLPTVTKGYWKLRRASSLLMATIYLSHSLGLQIGQTYLQLLFRPNLSFLPSTHFIPLFLGRGCNNRSPHFRSGWRFGLPQFTKPAMIRRLWGPLRVALWGSYLRLCQRM